jgi:hypothetical protein
LRLDGADLLCAAFLVVAFGDAFLEAAFLETAFLGFTVGAAFLRFTTGVAFLAVLVLLAAAVDLLVAGMIKSCVVGIKPQGTENRSPITVDIVTVEIVYSSTSARIVRAKSPFDDRRMGRVL